MTLEDVLSSKIMIWRTVSSGSAAGNRRQRRTVAGPIANSLKSRSIAYWVAYWPVIQGQLRERENLDRSPRYPELENRSSSCCLWVLPLRQYYDGHRDGRAAISAADNTHSW